MQSFCLFLKPFHEKSQQRRGSSRLTYLVLVKCLVFMVLKLLTKLIFFPIKLKRNLFFFRTMSQTRKSNTGKSSSGRPIKGTQFKTDPETVVERSLQEENRDTKFLFYYSQALFSCYLNADNWPAKTTTDFKLFLKAGQRTDMWH